MSEFIPGTVVQLRSGGPLLTVTTNLANNVHVIYFNSITGLYEKFATPGDCLREANQSPQVPVDARGMRHTTVSKSSL